MKEIERDENRAANPEALAQLKRLLADERIRSAFYQGYAHEPVLRVLVEHLGTKCSVADYWDRYSCGAAFLADDDVAGVIPDRPAWLEGIPFYVEGSAEAELYIYDMPVDGVLFAGRLARADRRPPNYILLTDEARACAGHPDYRWTVTPVYALGVREERVERYGNDEEVPKG